MKKISLKKCQPDGYKKDAHITFLESCYCRKNSVVNRLHAYRYFMKKIA